VLLLKTPQDCYRLKIFPTLFPNADIRYIHLTRGFAQTVNGLMDGWLDDVGFFAHNMELHDIELDIGGYTGTKEFGSRWWKFDLPPNWRDYIDSHLSEVCANQWHEAHRHILEGNVPTMLQIKFEDFLQDKENQMKQVTSYLGLKEAVPLKEIPEVMCTETPADYRWRKRFDLIMHLSKKRKVRGMMYELHYDMNHINWR